MLLLLSFVVIVAVVVIIVVIVAVAAVVLCIHSFLRIRSSDNSDIFHSFIHPEKLDSNLSKFLSFVHSSISTWIRTCDTQTAVGRLTYQITNSS